MDICEGLRVLILGKAPPEEREREEPKKGMGHTDGFADLKIATEEMTLKVYKNYRALLDTPNVPLVGPVVQEGLSSGANSPGGAIGNAPEASAAREAAHLEDITP